MNVAYRCDCMEYMRSLPDKAFDLAVVDPPYGSVLPSSTPPEKWTRFGGRFDRYKESDPDGRRVGSKVRKKNRELGLRPRRGLLHGTFQGLQKPDHLGRQLLPIAPDKVLSGLGQNQHSA